MDDDARFMMETEDAAEEEPAPPPEPCPRCGRTHMALFLGEKYQRFEIHAPVDGIRHDFFNQISARVHMRTCMDCGYIELYREELMRLDD